jgi:hypothetical protein
MTTGSITRGNLSYPAKVYGLSKVWMGGDGKYEPITHREKWNNYSMDLRIISDQLGQQDFAAGVTCWESFAWNAADDLRLQSKLVAQIKGHEFNLAVDLAQANQLVTMCAKTIRSLGRSLLHLKRGNVAAALRELGADGKNKKLKSKDVSSRWLEIQYGWLPSIGSAYQAAKAFEALSMGRTNRIVAKHQKFRNGQASCSPGNYSVPAYYLCRKKIVCELEEELSFARSLGLMDPLQVAWELLPFSFVLDWFLPIGTYLENLAVIPHLKGRFCSTTIDKYDSAFGVAKNPAWAGTFRLGHYRKMTRTVSTGLTTQLPRFVNPITAMTSKRIANAVSLAHQLLT